MKENFEYIRNSGGVEEYKLKTNDLTVLLMEDHSAPTATFMVTYHVGSRNEAVGHTGATHLLEHLMFKGSAKYNKDNGNSIWKVLQDVGAQINATTWFDRTNYFELLPKEHLDKAVSIEADRMRGAFLRDEDRQPEMTVVHNEYERGENDPFEVLDKNIWATAYQAHPYHHPTIGWRADIENISTDRLKEFYNSFYWPNNATATVIGDFSVNETLSLIWKHFGKIPRSPHKIPIMYTEEPPQEGLRRVEVKRFGEAPIIGVAHKSPEGKNQDTYPLHILGSILGSGKTSRFYRNIIDKGLAMDVSVWDHPFHDNGLFITYAFLTPETQPEEVEKLILDEYDSIQKDGVSEKEVARAQSKIKAMTAFSRDGSYSIASHLNEAIAAGDWTLYTTYLERVMEITPEDVHRVAQRYLRESQCTVGQFIPVTGSDEDKA
tara:strand:+ start:5978 stop:7279 length:1302 start_codon:yes stop_codon:yes gene_type:complete